MANPVTHALLPWQPRWVDHPPLFAALVGVFTLAAGETAPADGVAGGHPARPRALQRGVRRPPLPRWCAATSGRAVAAVAAALLAFTPVAVTASALVEAEWLLAVLLLGALLLVERRTGSAWCAWSPSACSRRWSRRRASSSPRRSCLLLLVAPPMAARPGVAAAGVVGMGLVVAWGAFVDWPAFVATTQAQFARHATPSNPLAFLMSLASGYGNRVPFRDPVWYAGLLGVVVALWRCAWRGAGGARPCSSRRWWRCRCSCWSPHPGRVTQWNGWYRLAIYPLVYVGAAWLVVELARLALRGAAGAARRSPRPA